MQKRKRHDILRKLPKAVQAFIAAIIAFVGATIIKLLLVNIFGL